MAHTVPAAGLASASPASGIAAALMSRLAKYREYRSTVNQLHKLSARELEDIGLARCDIESTAYYHTYGK